jgi:lipopolysaccharide/colanic/teichoic acid biosynthesis glycosyltransferase
MADRASVYSQVAEENLTQPGGASGWSHTAKRVFDVLVAALGLLALAPFFLIIAIAIKRDSPGPVFYRGVRLGRGGRRFNILKFRTMYERPESYRGPRITAQDDERVTKIGRWLRDAKLNELPQLWNVLFGEMSLVGPRPEDPEIGASWPSAVRREVLSMRPGITSPASVLYRNEETLLTSQDVMDTYLGSIVPSKLRLDQLYVRHHSLLMDLDILLWTSLVLFPRLGGYAPREERLFWGPVSRLARQYVSWFTIDALITLASIGLTGVIWRLNAPLNAGWLKAAVVGFIFVVFFSLTGALLGVNKITWSRADFPDAFSLLPGLFVAVGAAVLVNRVWVVNTPLPLGLILAAAAVSFAGSVLVRYRFRLVSEPARRWIEALGWAAEAQERMLIIGGGDTGQFAAWMLNRRGEKRGFRIIGYVDDDLYKQGTRIQGVNVVGRRADIPALVEKYDVGVIVFAIHNITAEERRALLDICAQTPARLLMMPDLIKAFDQVVASGGRASNGEKTRPSRASTQTGLVDLSPEQLEQLFARLAKLAEDGDLEALRQGIDQARLALHDHREGQTGS